MTFFSSLMMQVLARWISSGFGSGWAVIAPGTFGSAAALIFWWLLFSIGVIHSPLGSLVVLLVTTLVGSAAIVLCIRGEPSIADPQWIVIDEWAGLFVALLALTPSEWVPALLAFLLFRVFDASKFGPVGWAEQLPGALGIMADDLVAGALAAGVVGVLRFFSIV